MEANLTTVLLVGETANSLQLLQWLNKRGCNCQTAASFRDACTLLSCNEFDVVVSQYHLPDRTAFPLLDWLIGSSTTLFLSIAVETDSLWLLMLERGKRCFCAPTLRSRDFIEALQNVLDAKVQPDETRVAPFNSTSRLNAKWSTS